MSAPGPWGKMFASLARDLRKVVDDERAALVQTVVRHEERITELERLLAERRSGATSTATEAVSPVFSAGGTEEGTP